MDGTDRHMKKHTSVAMCASVKSVISVDKEKIKPVE